MTTGERIEQLAKERGLSIHKLAVLAGVSYNTLYSAVKRKSDRVDRKTVEKVAKALGVDITVILSEDQRITDFAEKAIQEFTRFDLEHGYPTVADCKDILQDIAEQLKE